MDSGNTELRYTAIDGASASQQPPNREDSQHWGFAAEMPHESARGGNQHCQFSKEISQDFAQPALASTSPGNDENDGNKKPTCINFTSQHEKKAFHLGACDGCATARVKCQKIEKPACQSRKRMKVTCNFSRIPYNNWFNYIQLQGFGMRNSVWSDSKKDFKPRIAKVVWGWILWLLENH